MTDPQSGRRYGTAVTLRLGRGRAVVEKTLVFIANLGATAAWRDTVQGFFIDGLSYYRFEDVVNTKKQ